MRLNHVSEQSDEYANNEEEPRGEVLEFKQNNSTKKTESWIPRGPSPVVWPDDHRYRDALIITPEGHDNITLSEAYYMGELTKEAEEKVNELTFKIGEKLRIIATRYSRVSEETALFNGA